jgi:uncharacterized glyoxalase superfamily protein PhnB
MNKLTPNLIVASIESCLPFWIDRLGFEKTVEVPESPASPAPPESPDEPRLGFVILRRGAVELMLQSRASLERDVPAIAAGPHRAVLYFEVADLAPLREALAGWPLAAPERTTFYGARELIVRDPEGHVIFLAAHQPSAR